MNKSKANAASRGRWTRAGTHQSYEAANDERQLLSNDETLDVKIRRRHATESFTVHFRKKPPRDEKKSKKKGRSAKSSANKQD